MTLNSNGTAQWDVKPCTNTSRQSDASIFKATNSLHIKLHGITSQKTAMLMATATAHNTSQNLNTSVSVFLVYETGKLVLHTGIPKTNILPNKFG
jgi:hypothetical protein